MRPTPMFQMKRQYFLSFHESNLLFFESNEVDRGQDL